MSAFEARANRVAVDEQVLLEMCERRRLGDEGVRFLHECDDADAHFSHLDFMILYA